MVLAFEMAFVLENLEIITTWWFSFAKISYRGFSIEAHDVMASTEGCQEIRSVVQEPLSQTMH